MLAPGRQYRIESPSISNSEELGVLMYYGLIKGAVFTVLSVYKKKGIAIIIIHEQTLLVRLTDLSCFLFSLES